LLYWDICQPAPEVYGKQNETKLGVVDDDKLVNKLAIDGWPSAGFLKGMCSQVIHHGAALG
jgi:hypothetical protein